MCVGPSVHCMNVSMCVNDCVYVYLCVWVHTCMWVGTYLFVYAQQVLCVYDCDFQCYLLITFSFPTDLSSDESGR